MRIAAESAMLVLDLILQSPSMHGRYTVLDTETGKDKAKYRWPNSHSKHKVIEAPYLVIMFPYLAATTVTYGLMKTFVA